MKKVVEKYNIGMIAEKREKEKIQEMLNVLLFDKEKRAYWKKGLELAAKELCWENEERRLLEIFSSAGLKVVTG
jgi:hypothetical protein